LSGGLESSVSPTATAEEVPFIESKVIEQAAALPGRRLPNMTAPAIDRPIDDFIALTSNIYPDPLQPIRRISRPS